MTITPRGYHLKDLERKYQVDPAFRTLVDSFQAILSTVAINPEDMHQAVDLANVMKDR